LATLGCALAAFVLSLKITFFIQLLHQADTATNAQTDGNGFRNTKCCRNFKVFSGFIYWLDIDNSQPRPNLCLFAALSFLV
jgi:hypothetical protein